MKFRYIIVDEFFSVKIFDPGNVTMGRQLARWLSHYDNIDSQLLLAKPLQITMRGAGEPINYSRHTATNHFHPLMPLPRVFINHHDSRLFENSP